MRAPPWLAVGLLGGFFLAANVTEGLAAIALPPMPSLPLPIVQVRSTATEQIQAAWKQAQFLNDAGRSAEAEELVKQALDLAGRTPRIDPRAPLGLQNILGTIYASQGRFAEAEQVLKAVLRNAESIYGPDSADSIPPMGTLSTLYTRQGRFAEAGPLAERMVTNAERRWGANDPATAEVIGILASIRASVGDDAGAEPLYRRALAIFQRNPRKNGFEIAGTLLNLGNLYQHAGQYQAALNMHHDAFVLDSQVYGPEHPDTMMALANGAIDYSLMNMFDEAAKMTAFTVDFAQKTYGPDSVRTAHALNNAGWIEIGRKDYIKALTFLRPALAAYLRNRTLQAGGPTSQGASVDEREVSRTILGLLKSLSAVAAANPSDTALVGEAFVAAQHVHRGKAEMALALTTARLAAGDGALAQLIREQQDLTGRRQAIDKALTQALSVPADRRDRGAEGRAQQELAQATTRIVDIDATIQKQFPDYATLADPQPVTIEEVQHLLGPDEAMVLAVPFGGANGEGTVLFVVTAGEAKWRATEIGATDLTGKVHTLLCGLDMGQWETDDAAKLCAQSTGAAVPKRGEPLPFDAGVAFQTFDTLFGDLAPTLKGKSLLVVAPDPLSSLPFEVLVTRKPATEKPKGDDYRHLDWLGRDNAISVLPSVTTLRGLRAHRGLASAPLPYIGFGDPILLGSRTCPRVEEASDACPADEPAGTLHASLVSRGPTRVDRIASTSSGQADLDAVRALCPLPETGVELRCVAKSLKVPARFVRTGPQATSPLVLAEDLSKFRIIHFATHGLLAGEMETASGTVAEPALVLTPPAKETAGDDGLLRASAVASLKLNADWVVLSACNTAAGASLGGEAMSGLASAFFYAGARALLVSHWPVQSEAAVLLTTSAFATLESDAQAGRAEALRRSIGTLIDGPDPAMTHPAIWAPFSVVGEGGTAH